MLSHDEKDHPPAGPRYVQNENGTRAVETWSHAIGVIDLTSKVTPDYALPEIHRQPADPLANLSSSADGTRLLTGHGVWDTSGARPKLLRELPSGLDLRDVRLSPDGRFMANTHRGWLHVTNRLRALLPSDSNNYYRELDIVPTEYRWDLGTARIVITKFHSFKRRERGDAGGLTKRLLTANSSELNCPSWCRAARSSMRSCVPA